MRHVRLRRILAFGCGAVALLVLVVAAGSFWVGWRTGGARYDDAARLPHERVAIVFGAGVHPDGRPTLMLADRVDAAAALYRAGRVDRLLMTGDNSRRDYDEVGAMRRRAVADGVPVTAIVEDHAGFDTYDSCVRARRIFGIQRAILVTQAFHVARALYTCRGVGVAGEGYAAPPSATYARSTVWRLWVRERLATVKALVDVDVRQPSPRFLGPQLGPV